DPPHDLGVLFIVPEMPLVEPFEGRSEVDLRPVLVVRLLDLGQNTLEVRTRWVHERPPQEARESAQVAQVEVLSVDREAESAEMIDEGEDRGPGLCVDLRVRRERRSTRLEALFRSVHTDPRG